MTRRQFSALAAGALISFLLAPLFKIFKRDGAFLTPPARAKFWTRGDRLAG